MAATIEELRHFFHAAEDKHQNTGESKNGIWNTTAAVNIDNDAGLAERNRLAPHSVLFVTILAFLLSALAT